MPNYGPDLTRPGRSERLLSGSAGRMAASDWNPNLKNADGSTIEAPPFVPVAR